MLPIVAILLQREKGARKSQSKGNLAGTLIPKRNLTFAQLKTLENFLGQINRRAVFTKLNMRRGSTISFPEFPFKIEDLTHNQGVIVLIVYDQVI